MGPNPNPNPVPADAFTELVLEVFRLNGRLLAAGDRLSAPVGLTSARWQILGALADGPATVAGIARSMGLTRQSVQRIADVLAAEGILAVATAAALAVATVLSVALPRLYPGEAPLAR